MHLQPTPVIEVTVTSFISRSPLPLRLFQARTYHKTIADDKLTCIHARAIVFILIVFFRKEGNDAVTGKPSFRHRKLTLYRTFFLHRLGFHYSLKCFWSIGERDIIILKKTSGAPQTSCHHHNKKHNSLKNGMLAQKEIGCNKCGKQYHIRPHPHRRTNTTVQGVANKHSHDKEQSHTQEGPKLYTSVSYH